MRRRCRAGVGWGRRRCGPVQQRQMTNSRSGVQRFPSWDGQRVSDRQIRPSSAVLKQQTVRAAVQCKQEGAEAFPLFDLLAAARSGFAMFAPPICRRRCWNTLFRSGSSNEDGGNQRTSTVSEARHSIQRYARAAAQHPAASVGNRAPAVLRRREQRCFSSASDDEVDGSMRAMREQLLNWHALVSSEPG